MFRNRFIVFGSILLLAFASTSQVFASSRHSVNTLSGRDRQKEATWPWVWNTFLGDPDIYPSTIHTDNSENVFIAGRDIFNGAFVAKFNSNGARQWRVSVGNAVAVSDFTSDTNGNLYVMGESNTSWGTPVHPFQGSGSKSNIFVAKLDSNGTVVWNTFWGWDEDNSGRGIALDANGNIVITGCFKAWVGAAPNYYDQRAFVMKLDAATGIKHWTTMLGVKQGAHCGHDIATDLDGAILVTGDSNRSWGTPLQPRIGYTDIFVAKLTNSGTLVWNTFMGSNDQDMGLGIALDQGGNAFITGISWATWGSPVDPFVTNSVSVNGFVVKLNQNGIKLWNTFLGDGSSFSNDIALDESGTVYIVGQSSANWGSPIRSYIGGGDGFVASINPGNGTLAWNSFQGGQCTDRGYAITIGTSGDVFTTGDSCHTWGQPVNQYGAAGKYDAFIVRQTPPQTHSETFASQAVQDGWILESAENSNQGGILNNTTTVFNLGDSVANGQYTGILSFNTGPNLPDNAIINEVILRLKKNNAVGSGDPVTIFQGFMVDIKTGFFGTSASLETADFQDIPSKTYGPANPSLVNSFYSINLTKGKSYINKLATNGGLTQMCLRFKLDDNNNAIANYLSLFSGNATNAADRPQLVITYYVP